MFDFQAIPADVIVGADAVTPPITPGCGLFLGQSDGQAVVFDVRRELIVRIPSADMIIVTHPNVGNYDDERLPPRCLSNEGNQIGG